MPARLAATKVKLCGPVAILQHMLHKQPVQQQTLAIAYSLMRGDSKHTGPGPLTQVNHARALLHAGASSTAGSSSII